MAYYYFHLHDRGGIVEDEEGRELAGMADVRAEALKGIRSIMADEILSGRIDVSSRIDVLDDQGRLVFSVSFRDAVELISD